MKHLDCLHSFCTISMTRNFGIRCSQFSNDCVQSCGIVQNSSTYSVSLVFIRFNSRMFWINAFAVSVISSVDDATRSFSRKSCLRFCLSHTICMQERNEIHESYSNVLLYSFSDVFYDFAIFLLSVHRCTRRAVRGKLKLLIMRNFIAFVTRIIIQILQADFCMKDHVLSTIYFNILKFALNEHAINLSLDNFELFRIRQCIISGDCNYFDKK